MNYLRTAKNLNRKVLTSSILTALLICMDTHAEKIALSWEKAHLELVNQHIVPSYQRLLKSSIQLQNDIASYCKPLRMTESDKKEDNYLKLLTHLDIIPSEFLMIGNSLKSDVLPLINIGAHSMHVPFHTTWIHEAVTELDQITNNYLTLKCLSDILKFLN